MDINEYKSQGHPLASYQGIIEDICYLLQDWVENIGLGTFENGGEFDTDKEELVYLLYDDNGNRLPIRLEGTLSGTLLEITSIVPSPIERISFAEDQ